MPKRENISKFIIIFTSEGETTWMIMKKWKNNVLDLDEIQIWDSQMAPVVKNPLDEIQEMQEMRVRCPG